MRHMIREKKHQKIIITIPTSKMVSITYLTAINNHFIT